MQCFKTEEGTITKWSNQAQHQNALRGVESKDQTTAGEADQAWQQHLRNTETKYGTEEWHQATLKTNETAYEIVMRHRTQVLQRQILDIIKLKFQKQLVQIYYFSSGLHLLQSRVINKWVSSSCIIEHFFRFS